MTKVPPVLSPVDYDAWERGYMPPTEHVLIDALSFRGTRVRYMSSLGPITTWLVVQTKDGAPLTSESIRALGKQWRAMMELELEILDDPSKPTAETKAVEGIADEEANTISQDNNIGTTRGE